MHRLWNWLSGPSSDTRAVPERQLWLLYAVAACTLLFQLFHQYLGEEGVYVIIAQEMRDTHDFRTPRLFGHIYGRPGLYSLLIYGLAEVIGWDHVRLAARLIAVLATIGTGFVLAWMVQRLFRDRWLAVFAAVAYLSGDVLIERGWLAYSDPLFGFFTFSAIACLWIAVEERRAGFLAVAFLCLVGSFLTKVATGYVFYGVMGLLLLCLHRNRWFLLSIPSLLLHGLAAACPFIWSFFIDPSVLRLLTRHVYRAETVQALSLLVNSAKIVMFLLPVAAVYIFCLYRRAVSLKDPRIVVAWLFLIINVPPYLLVTGFYPRYLMPLYPMFALAMSNGIAGSGKATVEVTYRALWLTVFAAVVLAVANYAYLDRARKGDPYAMALSIIEKVGDAPFYARDTTSVGLGLVAEVNTLRSGKSPLRYPPSGWQGFALVKDPETSAGDKIAERLNLGNQVRYLVCRGTVCPADTKSEQR